MFSFVRWNRDFMHEFNFYIGTIQLNQNPTRRFNSYLGYITNVYNYYSAFLNMKSWGFCEIQNI